MNNPYIINMYMYMDYFILVLLTMIFTYLVIRDVIVTRRRKTTHTITKRNSRKLDGIKESIDKQNKLLDTLLKVLSDDE